MDDIPLDANDLYALVRSVSKNGDFFMAAAELASSSHILNASQTVRLYEHIRDKSGRLEVEWRDDFIAAFSGFESILSELKCVDLLVGFLNKPVLFSVHNLRRCYAAQLGDYFGYHIG